MYGMFVSSCHIKFKVAVHLTFLDAGVVSSGGRVLAEKPWQSLSWS